MKALWVAMALFGLVFAVWLVLDTDERTDLDPTDAAFHLDRDGDRVILRYVTGDPLPTDRITVRIGTTDHAGTGLGLGDTWDAGETVCASGPGCLAQGDVTVTVFLDDVRLFRGDR